MWFPLATTALVILASGCKGGDATGDGDGASGGQTGSGGTPVAGAGGVSGGGGGAGGSGGVGGAATAGSGGDSSIGGRPSGSGGGGVAGAPGGTGGQRGGTGGATAGSGGTNGAGGGATAGPALAFPEAQGFGKNVTGARSGTVYHVTNLNDSGAGSFRDAVNSSNRFVVFDVGGYISLATAVSVKSNITIAGQTAPGGGIGFRGGEISFASSSNIICRFIRIRPGSETASTNDDALSVYRAHSVMIDHSCSSSRPGTT